MPSVPRRARSRNPSPRPRRPGTRDPGPRTAARPRAARDTQPLARILAVGDELMLGRTIDSNSATIARWAHDLGLRVDRIVKVGDRQDEIVAALRAAADGAALCVVSGGLGPTDDDRTRHALAEAMGVALDEDARAWRMIVAHYARIRPGVEVPPRNRRQALVPRGASLLSNDRGTAPGLLGRIGRCHVACVPGVPHEMEAMIARLGRQLPRQVRGLRVPAIGELWFSGIGESDAQELLGDLLTERDPQVGITVSELGHITLRAVGTPAQVRARVAAMRRCIRRWALPAAGLAPSLVRTLTRRDLTITTAESCTVGHAAAQLGAVPGASRVLRQALVAYHTAVKTAALGVPAEVIAEAGVVSEAVARAMAEGALRSAGADLAVATTGVAGPDGGTVDNPVGTVWVAAAMAGRTVARRHVVKGSRERVQRRAAAQALLIGWDLLVGRI